MSFDYSEAWAMQGVLQTPALLAADCRTHQVMQWLKQIGGLRTADIGEILQRIGRLTPKAIQSIAETIPDEWLPTGGKGAIIDWWVAPETMGRLAILSAQYPCATVTTTASSV